MARTLYAGRPGDTVAALFNIGERLVYALPADANGDPTAVTLTVWDEPDGTQYTDLLAADGTTPITAVMVPPGTVQIPAFYGPDGVTDELWLRDPEGDYTRLDLGPTGAPGAAGISIVDVERTSGTGAPGTTDTYTITYTDDSTSTFQVYNGANGTGTGDVSGPASSTNNRIAVFDGITGKLIKDSGKSLSEFQPIDLDLSAIAALISAANKMPYATGPGTWSLADLTAFARTLLDDADAATARATLEAAGSTGGAREKTAALSATIGTATGNLDNASIFTVTPTGNITLAFSNVPASGTACTVTVIVTQGGTVRTVTPPTGTKWMGAAAPTQTANKACMFTFLTVNGGTTWYASAAVEQ